MMKRLLSLLLLLAATACTPYHLVPAGPVDFTGKDAGTQTAIPWNGRNYDAIYTWTQDGPDLQNMIFHLGIADGQTLATSLDVESKFHPLMVLAGKVPDEVSFRFQRTMAEPDITDLFAASLSKITGTPVATTNLRPATFSGEPGFRFDYSFTGKDEVKRQGIAVGAVVDAKLYLVHYYGTELYHFGKNRDNAEQVIAAFKLKKKS
ncbi:MAG: hypothetical protein H7Z12_18340 [Rhodospirillaceae bacterium]|nr:hypothetical protein [Rhodospirillales bacterium]